MHINKVYHYNTAHIAQAQLACNFFGSFFINLECILFLVFLACGTVAAIYINNMQGFSMLYYQVGTACKVYCFTKSRFYLFVYAILFKYGNAIFVQADNTLHFR